MQNSIKKGLFSVLALGFTFFVAAGQVSAAEPSAVKSDIMQKRAACAQGNKSPHYSADAVNRKSCGRNLPYCVTAALPHADVVFFGEKHDNSVHHKMEFEALKELYCLKKGMVVLSMEMFEADVQPVLNSYLEGKITEKEFLEKSRPWPNYKEDYRPMVEFAKHHKIPVIASNIPRYLAAQIAKKGAPEENINLPAVTTKHSNDYKEKFSGHMELMASMSKNPAMRAMLVKKVDNMFKAQCLKDDKMAENIAKATKEFPGRTVFHVNGCFHSDSYLGTVEALHYLEPALKTAVISPDDIKAEAEAESGI